MEAMGRDERPTAAAVIDRLMRWPHGFNVFQALSLIERYAHDHVCLRNRHMADGRHDWIGTDDIEDDCVRIVGHVSLAFSPSDVHSVSLETADTAAAPDRAVAAATAAAAACVPAAAAAAACAKASAKAEREVANGAGGSHGKSPSGERRRYALRTPVMTLAGAQGPLPTAFTELVLERDAEREHATRDFLDVFNHRFLSFLYRSRKKHVLGLHGHQAEDAPLAKCLRAIGALERDQQAWLRHAGLLCSAPRSISGLVTLLRDRLGVKVRAESLIGEWHTLDPEEGMALSRARGRLGAGRSSVLGQRAWQQAGAIRLDIGPLTAKQLCSLLPGGERYALLQHWVGAYLPMPLGVHLRLIPSPEATSHCARLIGASMPLGWRSWLSGGKALASVELRLHISGEIA